MKTEDIDKKIGMPDVNEEWAKFEREVINKKAKHNRRALYAWIGGMGIAASLLLFFVLSMKDELAEEPQLTAQTMIEKRTIEAMKVESAEVEAAEVEATEVEAAEVEEVEVEVAARPNRMTGIDDGNDDVPHTIDMEEYEGLATIEADEALQGRIDGLEIVQNTGDLGAGRLMRLSGSKDSVKSDTIKILPRNILANIRKYEQNSDPNRLTGSDTTRRDTVIILKDVKIKRKNDKNSTNKWKAIPLKKKKNDDD
jgi:hypothetical protein